MQILKRFNVMFNWMPIAATIGGKIFCVHGGLSPDMNTYDQILKLERPIEVQTDGIYIYC